MSPIFILLIFLEKDFPPNAKKKKINWNGSFKFDNEIFKL